MWRSLLPSLADFNPRSREGSDHPLAPHRNTSHKFQSTLPRRERHYKGFTCKFTAKISIHAPAKGATRLLLGRTYKRRISIHAPAKGATCSSFLCCPVKQISIHAPAKGATLFCLARKPKTKFQSTLPRRERRCV